MKPTFAGEDRAEDAGVRSDLELLPNMEAGTKFYVNQEVDQALIAALIGFPIGTRDGIFSNLCVELHYSGTLTLHAGSSVSATFQMTIGGSTVPLPVSVPIAEDKQLNYSSSFGSCENCKLLFTFGPLIIELNRQQINLGPYNQGPVTNLTVSGTVSGRLEINIKVFQCEEGGTGGSGTGGSGTSGSGAGGSGTGGSGTGGSGTGGSGTGGSGTGGMSPGPGAAPGVWDF